LKIIVDLHAPSDAATKQLVAARIIYKTTWPGVDSRSGKRAASMTPGVIFPFFVDHTNYGPSPSLIEHVTGRLPRPAGRMDDQV